MAVVEAHAHTMYIQLYMYSVLMYMYVTYACTVRVKMYLRKTQRLMEAKATQHNTINTHHVHPK